MIKIILSCFYLIDESASNLLIDQVDTPIEKLANFTSQVDASLGLIVILNMWDETGGDLGQGVGKEKEDTGMTVRMTEGLTAQMMNRREGKGKGEERKRRKR